MNNDYVPLTLFGLPVLDANGVPIEVKDMEVEPYTEVAKTRLVIIHDTDADGICAAWCINKGFKDDYNSVLLIPQRAGTNTIPEGLTENDTVFMVDRTYPWAVLFQLSQQVFSVTVIDHHKSAMNDYMHEIDTKDITVDSHTFSLTESSILFDYGNITVNIDTNHSACMLAHLWVLEHGTDPDTSVGTPWFVSYIEDRDIWKWNLPDSKEINAGLHYYGHTFERYDRYVLCEIPGYSLDNIKGDYIGTIRSIGSVVLNTQLKIIKSIAHGPTVGFKQLNIVSDNLYRGPDLDGKDELRFAIVCVPFTLISDFGSYMLNYNGVEDITECAKVGKVANPFITPDVVLCYNEVDEGFTYSIRSKYDMIWLAKMFNGGGHPNACGFTTPVPPNAILEVVKFRFANPEITVDIGEVDNIISPSFTDKLISNGF